MKQQFECKVKYKKIDEKTGKEKIAKELYLIDAVSFTDAEVYITAEFISTAPVVFEIISIKRSNYAEIHLSEHGGNYFRVVINLVTLDESSGKEKKQSMPILVQSSDSEEAVIFAKSLMRDSITDFEIPSVSETKIVDVI